jgi:hypothetical protein
MFARRMGKNETSAQLEAYFLASFSSRGRTQLVLRLGRAHTAPFSH